MRKLSFILLLMPLTGMAQPERFSPAPFPYDADAPAYARICNVDDKDVTGEDGRTVRLFSYSCIFCYYNEGMQSGGWQYIKFTNGVRALLDPNEYYTNPLTWKPGFYNHVEKWVKVVDMDSLGNPIVETKAKYLYDWRYSPERDNWRFKYLSEPKSKPDRGDSNSEATGSETSPDKSTSSLSGCSCKGIPLHGKVKIVSSYPDFKVKIASSYPDLKVKKVTMFPDHCGEWQFVESSYPDFTVQFVESYPDFTIQYVSSFPGR
jgi:hypothetical protein